MNQRANVQLFSRNITVNSDLSGPPTSKSEIPVFFTLQSTYFTYFRLSYEVPVHSQKKRKTDVYIHTHTHTYKHSAVFVTVRATSEKT